MKLLSSYKKQIIFFTGIFLLFLFSRIYRIETLPLFTDEAIYVRWSQIARYDAAWRFISLTDGKQPSFVWIAMNIMRVVKDPLLAGRLVSVLSGFFSLIGMFFLAKEVFKNRRVGYIASVLYLIFPMALVYDRMALYDSLVGCFTIWALYFEILLIRNLRLSTALILGMVAGAGVLTKTSGFFNIYLLPFSLLLLDFKDKKRITKLLRWGSLALVAVVLTYGYYSILRLSPFFHIINDKNSIFVYPFGEWIKHPLNFLNGNLLGVWDWFIIYMTWPVIALIVGSFFIERKFFKEKILLFAWFILPFFALALFGRVLYPRFIFFMTLSLLPLAALSLSKIIDLTKNKFALVGISILLFGLMIRSDFFILNNFAKAPIPFSDLEQYINGWPAGGGVKEIVSFLDEKSKSGKIYVATEGTFGSLPTYAVEIYLNENKNIEKRGMWPVPEKLPKDLLDRAKKIPVYFVFNNTQEKPPGWPIEIIARYQKGVGPSYMSIYKVVAN